MIPRTIHQIWIGPKPIPNKWVNTWKDLNPNFNHILWNNESVWRFDFRYKDKIDTLIAQGLYGGATDIMRIEILERHGGVYVDADSICTATIEDAPFMKSLFFVNREFDHKRKDWTNRVQNGHIGATPNHPILKTYLDRMKNIDVSTPDWMELGGKMLTGVIDEQIMLLPVCTLTPVCFDGRIAPDEGKTYAKHMWGTTRGNYYED